MLRMSRAPGNDLLRHLSDIEYRTCPCKTREEARQVERDIQTKHGQSYTFNT